MAARYTMYQKNEQKLTLTFERLRHSVLVHKGKQSAYGQTAFKIKLAPRPGPPTAPVQCYGAPCSCLQPDCTQSAKDNHVTFDLTFHRN